MKIEKFLKVSVLLASLLLMVGCFDDSTDDNVNVDEAALVITESDFFTGAWFGSLDEDGYHQGVAIHSDVSVKIENGETYLLEKFGADNITKLTEAGEVAYQVSLSVNDNWNPQDLIVSSSSKGYIASYTYPEVRIFNPATGDSTGAIDISAHTNNPEMNSSPNAHAMVLVDGKLFVGIQRLDMFEPTVASQILVINTTNDAIESVITCEGRNLSQLLVVGNYIYVVNSDDTYPEITDNGTIEKIDLLNGNAITTLHKGKISEGTSMSITHKSDEQFFVSTYKAYGEVPVSLFDFGTDSKVSDVADVINSFGGIIYDKTADVLYVAEMDAVAFGILKYFPADGTSELVKTTLPPSSIALK
jgi:hypothetical protein